jgi:hypothetical protein
VAHCPNPAAVDLALFYEYCQVDKLLYDLTACCTYELYQSARTAIDKVEINEWRVTRRPIIRRSWSGGFIIRGAYHSWTVCFTDIKTAWASLSSK